MKRYRTKESTNTKEEETVQLPPRSSIHKSEKNKWTQIFYKSLTVLFIVLTVGLLAWGFLLFQ